MTKHDDLRRLLDELSDEVPEVPTQEWLSGTRHKVRVRRRARWVSTGVAMALVLAAAIAVVPQVLRDSASGPDSVTPVEPDAPREWNLPVGTEFHRVVATRMNTPDSSELQWSVKLAQPADRLYSMQFCRLPAGWPTPGKSKIQAVWSINGNPIGAKTCGYWRTYPPVTGRMVSTSIIGLNHYDVRSHKTFTVSMWLERDEQRINIPNSAFGVGFYSCNIGGMSRAHAPDGCGQLVIPVW